MRVNSVSEVAGRFRVTPRTVRNMIERGELDAFRVGGSWRVLTAEVERIERGESRVPAAS